MRPNPLTYGKRQVRPVHRSLSRRSRAAGFSTTRFHERLEERQLLAAQLELSLSQSKVSEGAGNSAIVLTVRRIDPIDLASPLNVNLGSGNQSELAIPTNVVIPANQATTVIAIDTINDALIDGTVTVQIVGSANGHANGATTIEVTDDDTAALKIIGGQLTGVLPAGEYRISHSLAVPVEQSLALQPGTVLKFSAGQSLDVYGALQVNALEKEAVRFVSGMVAPKAGDWAGIRFLQSGLQPRSTLANAVVQQATQGITIAGASPRVTLDTVEVRLAENDGIVISGAATAAGVQIQNSVIRDNGRYGIAMSAVAGTFCTSVSTAAAITGNEISGNVSAGIWITASASPACVAGDGSATAAPLIERNRISRNGFGVQAEAVDSLLQSAQFLGTLRNNFIEDHPWDGVRLTRGVHGGDLAPQLFNNTIVRNLDHGIFHEGALAATSRIVNNLVAFNGKGVAAEVLETPADNSVAYNNVFGNTTSNWLNYPAQYGAITNSGADAAHNRAIDPRFDSDRLHLKLDSPLVNAGASTSLYADVPTTDVDQESRIGLPDIGADEASDAARVPRISLSTATPTVTEKQANLFFVLNRSGVPLAGDLTISLSSSQPSRVQVPATVTIPAGRASLTAVATIVDNSQVDPASLVTLTASALGFATIGQSLQIIDDDAAGFVIDTTLLTVNESGTKATANVVLNSRPNSDVVLQLSIDDASEASITPTTLRFTQANWQQPQSFEVTGLPDLVDDGLQTTQLRIRPNTSQSDPAFASVPEKTVQVNVIDRQLASMELLRESTDLVLRDLISGQVLQRTVAATATTSVTGSVDERIRVRDLGAVASDLQTAGGNDRIEIESAQFGKIAGNAGTDQLDLYGQAITLDLTTLVPSRLSGIEAIDLTHGTNHQLTLDGASVRSLIDATASVLSLAYHSDADVNYVGAWTVGEPKQVSGARVHSISSQGVTVEITNDSPWQNPIRPLDVDRGGTLQPRDALMVINALNRYGVGAIATVVTDPGVSYVDCNGDGKLEPLDALIVINELNRLQAGAEPDPIEFWKRRQYPIFFGGHAQSDSDRRGG